VLKTRPKQILGSLQLVIALPILSLFKQKMHFQFFSDAFFRIIIIICKGTLFCISATYEMRTTEYNRILYFNDVGHLRKMGFYMEQREDKHTERQRVRERVSASVGQRRGQRRSTSTNTVGRNTFAYDYHWSASLIN
jgi:hypothetical protein